MVPATIGSPSIIATANKLCEGDVISLEDNTVINNKNLTFTCDIAELSGEGVIRLGHGKTAYGATYIEIDETEIRYYNYASELSEPKTYNHGLTIKDYLTVSIDADYGSATVSLMTSGGYYTGGAGWSGRNGAIFAEVENTEVENVTMRWYCEDYRNNIWLVGDSYFSSTSTSRWTSYLIKNGYKKIMLMSHSGMRSERGITEVKQALAHGTPKYIVWCMGMNNGDSGGTVNSKYLAATEEFLEICAEKGITPILSTIPSTPTVDNSAKNEWVKNWALTTGGRYIDFARAVGGDRYDASLIGKKSYVNAKGVTEFNSTGYEWYANMLYADLVHPDELGAKALYMQALADFPELMREN
jgi:lysophospholipase L1-like esterase